MADIDLYEVRKRYLNDGSSARLLEAAASVANAISAGLGGMVQGTLMEQELRDALGLKDGEMVNIPKR